jgi:hypothetical protein
LDGVNDGKLEKIAQLGASQRLLFAIRYFSGHIKNDGMGGTCSPYEREIYTKMFDGKPEGMR